MAAGEDDAPLARYRLYEVGTRVPLLMGCERGPFLLTVMLAVVISYSGMSLPYFVMSVVLIAGAIPALRAMARSDPRLMIKLTRHFKLCLKGYYPAQSSPFASRVIMKQ